MLTNIKSIPEELKQTARFCVWKYEDRNGGKPTKVPYTPQTGERAKSNDRNTFTDFETAIKHLNGYDGLGVGVFGNLVAIDIDDCFINGKLSDVGKDVISLCNTYTEISPSGEGLRLFGTVKDFTYDKHKYRINYRKYGLEIYVAGATSKYVSVTGNVFGNVKPVADITDGLYEVLDYYMRREETPTPIPKPQAQTIENGLSDSEIIQKASAKYPYFSDLMSGNWQVQFNSQSDADMSFCRIVAFYSGGDANTVDRLLRQSGLYRRKWDRQDYRENTIQRAVSACTDYYKPKATEIAPTQTPVFEQPEETVTLTPLSEIEETVVDWLIPGRIPRGEVTLLAGDGGTGKTTITCNLIASVTNGSASILDDANAENDRTPQSVLFFSSEDDFSKVLKGRLKGHGADLNRILTIETADKRFQELKFDSPLLEKIIRDYQPALCVFDPLQSFIPKETNMGARNEMRNCLNHLVGLAHSCNTTFIILMHTNKRIGAYGRNRLADSADIWDIARSVLIVGYTDEEGLRYCSNEKNSYAPQAETVLFRVDGNSIIFDGTTLYKDADYVRKTSTGRDAPDREVAKTFIEVKLREADEHMMEVKDLDFIAKQNGISKGTLARAKNELSEAKIIEITNQGFGKSKKWIVRLIE